MMFVTLYWRIQFNYVLIEEQHFYFTDIKNFLLMRMINDFSFVCLTHIG